MIIPGAYERDTLTRRQPGAMTGAAYGTDGLDGGETLLDAATRAERQREGGSRTRHRRTNGRFSWLRFWRFADR
jgi:hypothetical protein